MPAGVADPVLDQLAALFARAGDGGGPQMAQPAEGVKLARPGLARRFGVENRKPLDVDAFAAEHPAAVVNVLGHGRVGGAQVNGRDLQALRDAAHVTPAVEHAGVKTIADGAANGTRHEAELPSLTGSR